MILYNNLCRPLSRLFDSTFLLLGCSSPRSNLSSINNNILVTNTGFNKTVQCELSYWSLTPKQMPVVAIKLLRYPAEWEELQQSARSNIFASSLERELCCFDTCPSACCSANELSGILTNPSSGTLNTGPSNNRIGNPHSVKSLWRANM